MATAVLLLVAFHAQQPVELQVVRDEEGVLHRRPAPALQDPLSPPRSPVFEGFGNRCFERHAIVERGAAIQGGKRRATLVQAMRDCLQLPLADCAAVSIDHLGFSLHASSGQAARASALSSATLATPAWWDLLDGESSWVRVAGCAGPGPAADEAGEHARLLAARRERRVPPLIHQVWLTGGSKTVYPRPEQMMRTWSQAYTASNPAWSYRLWTDDDIPSVCSASLIRLIDATKRMSCKADVMRVCILSTHGGVLIDADSIWLNSRPLELAIGDASFVAAVQHNNALLAAGWLATTKGHPLIASQLAYYE